MSWEAEVKKRARTGQSQVKAGPCVKQRLCTKRKELRKKDRLVSRASSIADTFSLFLIYGWPNDKFTFFLM